MTDPWKAEMPEVFSVVTRGRATVLTGCFERSPMCDERDVAHLVTRANEELAKVRAERDAALKAFAAACATRIVEAATLTKERDAALARVRELEFWNERACECPPPKCDCPGCSLVREENMQNLPLPELPKGGA